jgi:DNA-binding MarR family transcriptional regulator
VRGLPHELTLGTDDNVVSHVIVADEKCPGRKVIMAQLTQQDFERLLEFRVTLRRFQRWSEDQAKAAGLTHVQHQLLVAIKGHPGDRPPTIGDLAGYLLLRPHSAVELVDRAEAAGLVERTPDRDDGRVVRVRLTGNGEEILQRLTRAHLDRLHELAVVLDEFVTSHNGAAAEGPGKSGTAAAPAPIPGPSRIRTDAGAGAAPPPPLRP